jgi:hypothetical protein
MSSERDRFVFCLKFTFIAFIIYLNADAIDDVYGQISSTSTILSISTIPTCVSVYGPGTTNTQRLCGSGPNNEVTSVRMNINIGQDNAGAETLVFTAFPFGNTSIPGGAPSLPCDNVPLGQNCTALKSPIFVTWKTYPIAAAYTMRPLAPKVPLAYLSYKAPFVVSDDDQDIGWRGDSDVDQCVFNNNQNQMQCPFMAAGAFVRNKNTPLCAAYNITSPALTCPNDQKDKNCQYACGDAQVEAFLQCGGFIEECSGLNPQTQLSSAGFNQMCSCFPYAMTSQHWNELKQGGMHQTPAGLYLDDGCGLMSSGLLSDPNPNHNNGAGGPMNYPNSAVAMCRHMVNLLKLNDDPVSKRILSNQEPFVTVDPSSICSIYSYAQKANLGCGFPWNSNSGACQGDAGNCYYQHGDTPAYNYFNDYLTCIGNSSGSVPLNDQSCWAGTDPNNRNAQAQCQYPYRFGSLWPLSGLYVADPSQAVGENAYFGVPCVTCRYNYKDSTYMPGNSGNQRKGKLWVEDFRDAWVGAFSNANFDPNSLNSISGLNPTEGSVGFNYYKIANPVTGTDDVYVLSPVWAMQILQSCSPGMTSETCFGSFNQPVDFFTSGSSDPSQSSNIRTQGVEGAVQTGQGRNGMDYTKRGLGTTATWKSCGSDQEDCGFHIKCGTGCDPTYNADLSTTFSATKLAQNVAEIGLAKSITEVGPDCSAFAVSLQGKVFTGVEFEFNYIDQDGNNVTKTMSLTTENIGTGNTVQFLDIGDGVVGQINGDLSPTDQSPPEIGGIAVICGANDIIGVGAGSLNGQFSGDYRSFMQNPWNLLIDFITAMETGGNYPGITGAKQGGCPVPIPSFVTVLQCFSVATACAAPMDLCQAVHDMCSSGAYDCVSNNMKPVVVKSIDQSSYSVNNPDDVTDTQTCSIQKSNDVKGVSWYWLPSQMINAFGTQCGQYGMNSYTFAKDAATQQFMCQHPYSQNAGVPCVPGISENTGVPSPCQAVGDLATFHGQTSNYAATTYGPPNSPKQTTCLSPDQISFIESVQYQKNAYQGGCSNINNGFTNFSQKAFKPAFGLPPRWQITDPQYWISNGYLMSSDTLLNQITLDVTLEISGYGLNAQVINVDGGRFVNSGFGCQLEQNSEGIVNISMQNTGGSVADYIITIDNCTDPSGLLSNPVNLGLTPTTQKVPGVNPGEVVAVSMPINIDALGKVQSLICNFHLSPDAIQTMILSTIAINCNVDGFLQTATVGETGSDGKLLSDPDNQMTGCQGKSVGFGCWMINGGLLSHVVFWTLLAVILIVSISVLVSLVRYNYFYEKGIESSEEYDDLAAKNIELRKAQEEKEAAERLKGEELIRQRGLERNLPVVTEAFARAFNPQQ